MVGDHQKAKHSDLSLLNKHYIFKFYKNISWYSYDWVIIGHYFFFPLGQSSNANELDEKNLESAGRGVRQFEFKSSFVTYTYNKDKVI